MSYIRNLIPLESEAKGFGYKNRQPAGRSLVEGRDHNYKLTVWAQDLKPQTLYSVFILFSADKRYAGIPMGRLIIDEKGKGEIRKEFDDAALGEFDLTDFVAIAVITRDNHGVSSPLCGYKDTPVSWRHGFYEYSIPARVEQNVTVASEVPAKTHEVKSEPIAEEKPIQEDAAKAEETPPKPCEIDSAPIEPLAEAQTQEELPVMELHTLELHTLIPPTPVAQPEDTPTLPITEDIHPPPQAPPLQNPPPQAPSPHEAPSTNWNLPQSEMAKAFRTALDNLRTDTIQNANDCEPKPDILLLFETREFITPFQKQARKADWISFTPSDPIPPPTNKPQLFDDPFIQAALAEYHHLILGLTTDQGPRRYIIGVPGVYSQESKQKAKRLGFTQFKCTRDALPSWGEAGYWLMFTTVC